MEFNSYYLNMSVWNLFYSMADPPGVILLKKTDYRSLSSYQIPIVPQLPVRFLSHPHAGDGLPFSRTCACCHNGWKFLYATALLSGKLFPWSHLPLLTLIVLPPNVLQRSLARSEMSHLGLSTLQSFILLLCVYVIIAFGKKKLL